MLFYKGHSLTFVHNIPFTIYVKGVTIDPVPIISVTWLEQLSDISAWRSWKYFNLSSICLQTHTEQGTRILEFK